MEYKSHRCDLCKDCDSCDEEDYPIEVKYKSEYENGVYVRPCSNNDVNESNSSSDENFDEEYIDGKERSPSPGGDVVDCESDEGSNQGEEGDDDDWWSDDDEPESAQGRKDGSDSHHHKLDSCDDRNHKKTHRHHHDRHLDCHSDDDRIRCDSSDERRKRRDSSDGRRKRRDSCDDKRKRRDSSDGRRKRRDSSDDHDDRDGRNCDSNDDVKFRRFSHMRMTRVRMPTGKKFYLTIPIQKKDREPCRAKTRLVTLYPNGRMGYREHKIVTKEVENTMLSSESRRSRCRVKGFRFIKVQKVVNSCLWRRFRHCQKMVYNQQGFVTEKMLFLGSKHAKDILENGLHFNKHARYGPFGEAMYLSKHSTVSNEYVFSNRGYDACRRHGDKDCTSCVRKLILCRVTLGKSLCLSKAKDYDHAPHGYNSVKGHASKTVRFPEYAVWKGAQVYPDFVIYYKIKV